VTGGEPDEKKTTASISMRQQLEPARPHSTIAIARQLHSALLCSSRGKSNAAATGGSLPNMHRSIKRTPIN
jgi:hypothetical protein